MMKWNRRYNLTVVHKAGKLSCGCFEKLEFNTDSYAKVF